MAKLFNAHSDRFPLHYIDQYVEMEPQVEEIDPEVAKIIEKERRLYFPISLQNQVLLV